MASSAEYNEDDYEYSFRNAPPNLQPAFKNYASETLNNCISKLKLSIDNIDIDNALFHIGLLTRYLELKYPITRKIRKELCNLCLILLFEFPTDLMQQITIMKVTSKLIKNENLGTVGLELDWKPFYNLLLSIHYSCNNGSTQMDSKGILNTHSLKLKDLISKCSCYFQQESFSEILNEILPYFNPYDIYYNRSIDLLLYFLPYWVSNEIKKIKNFQYYQNDETKKTQWEQPVPSVGVKRKPNNQFAKLIQEPYNINNNNNIINIKFVYSNQSKTEKTDAVRSAKLSETAESYYLMAMKYANKSKELNQSKALFKGFSGCDYGVDEKKEYLSSTNPRYYPQCDKHAKINLELGREEDIMQRRLLEKNIKQYIEGKQIWDKKLIAMSRKTKLVQSLERNKAKRNKCKAHSKRYQSLQNQSRLELKKLNTKITSDCVHLVHGYANKSGKDIPTDIIELICHTLFNMSS